MRLLIRSLPVLVLSLAACGGGTASTSGAGGQAQGGAGGQAQGGGGAGGQAQGGEGGATGGGGAGASGGAPSCGADPVLPEETLGGGEDPEAGDFTLDEALAGLPEGPGPLRAILETDLGTLTCELFPDDAPIGVANFVGLARGTRPFREAGTWVKRRFYDGLTFHRVIPGFVAQGGDPLGSGFGGPGYEFDNEIAGLTHVAGTLAYANAGPDTNGSQFYVCETPQPQLDSGYTIFGLCEPVSVVTDITNVPTNANDQPLTPVLLQSVTITRCAP
jgi:peptidyl-prolyl cis-trans isomerase A (cyclophilin A)